MGANDTRRSRVAAAAFVVAAMFTVGVLFVHLGRDASPSHPDAEGRPSTSRSSAPSSTAGAVSQQAGMAIGFSRSEEGAVAAAVAHATASQRWLYFTDDEIRAAVAEIATPVAAGRLAADVVAEIGLARDQLGASPGRVWWLVRPMAWRLEHHGSDEASVSVWVVTVLAAAEVAAPQTEWLTVTIDLAWVDGDWRVNGVRDAPGPTPIAGPRDQPWDAGPFDEALAGFTRMDGDVQ